MYTDTVDTIRSVRTKSSKMLIIITFIIVNKYRNGKS